MLWANIPIVLIFARKAMAAYHHYVRQLKAGVFHPHEAKSLPDIIDRGV